MTSLPATKPSARPEVSSSGPAPRRARWIELGTSADHKLIGLVLISAAFGSLFLASLELLLTRAQLAVPENVFMNAVTFDRLLSVYGTTSIFLVALPLLLGLLYFVVPLQIGSRGTSLPRVGQTGLWLFIVGGFLLYGSFLFTPPEAGINPLPPLSELNYSPNNGVDVWIASTGLITLGLLFVSIDLLTTVRNLRAPGMTWRRAPFFTWAGLIVPSLFAVVAPIFLATITMLMLDRRYGSGFFEGSAGGSPILWQHLTNIFFTAVYMSCAVGFLAAIAEIVQTFTRRTVRGRNAILASLVAIAVLGTLAWTQNMVTTPIPSGWKYYGMIMALSLIIPFGLIFYNLLGSLSAADAHMRAPLRFALGALSLASIGLAAEMVHSTIGVGTLFAETVDAWAATHFALVGFVVFGGFAAVSYWYPKMTGRMLDENRARISFWVMFAGTLIALLPLLAAGVMGQVSDAYRFYADQDVSGWNLISSIGTLILFIGVILAVGNLVATRERKADATPDPWRGDSLEWLALSPPEAHNFDVLPDVRSDRPMRDIREALVRRDSEAAPGESQPVA